MPEADYYAVLGVPITATPEAIKSAYREQIKRYHPDSLQGEFARRRDSGNYGGAHDIQRRIEEYQRKTQEINTAYRVLSDADQRKKYDERRVKPFYKAHVDIDEWNAPTGTHRAGPYAEHRAQARPRPKAKEDAFPTQGVAILFIGLLIVLLAFFSLIVSILFDDSIAPSGSSGGISALELQETRNAIQATYIVRTQRAQLPTATPRPPALNAQIAGEFYANGNDALAIELYSLALKEERRYEWAFMRGIVQLRHSFRTQSGGTFLNALADFGLAISLRGQ